MGVGRGGAREAGGGGGDRDCWCAASNRCTIFAPHALRCAPWQCRSACCQLEEMMHAVWPTDASSH